MPKCVIKEMWEVYLTSLERVRLNWSVEVWLEALLELFICQYRSTVNNEQKNESGSGSHTKVFEKSTLSVSSSMSRPWFCLLF